MGQRLVKFENNENWFTIDDLKNIIKLLEKQESINKDESGNYYYNDGVLNFDYFIDYDGDIIIEE